MTNCTFKSQNNQLKLRMTWLLLICHSLIASCEKFKSNDYNYNYKGLKAELIKCNSSTCKNDCE